MSHLPTLRNNHVKIWYVFASVPCLGHLHLLDHIHAVDDAPKDGVLTVEERRRHRRDEKLRAVGVGT